MSVVRRGTGREHSLVGIAAVLLWVIGVVVVEAAGDSPDDDATAPEFVRYFENEEGAIYAGSLLFFLGSLLLVWWVSHVRTVVAQLDRPGSRLPSVIFGAGVAMAVLSMGFVAPQISGAFAANETDAPLVPGAAQALWYAGDGFFVATEYMAALLMVSLAVAITRLRFLPRWMAWAALVIAVALLIPFIGWVALVFAFPLWVIVASLLRWRGVDDQPR
jgi:hypothetical protein